MTTRDYRGDFERLILLDEDCMQRRYEILRHVRETHPVFWSDTLGRWIFTRYADVRAALNDVRLSNEQSPSAMRQLPAAIREQIDFNHPLFRQSNKIMMARDEPDHGRLRTLVHKDFSPRTIAQQREQIAQLAHTFLEQMEQQAQPDFVRDLAIPLPITVIALMLGLPYDDRERLKRWSDTGADFLGQAGNTVEVFMQMAQVAQEFNEYLQPYIEERRRKPQDDLLSAFIQAEAEGDRLSQDELVANVFLLLAAGNETTTNLLSNGLWTLLRHPDQVALLREHPELINSAVEEILRYESPSQVTGRRTKAETELAGQVIPEDTSLMLMLGAANRDPAQFADPDRFDITRRDNKHIGFGLGPHFCLGAPLARLEAQIILPIILERYPNLHLVDDHAHWRKNPTFLGQERLPLSLS